MGVFVISEINVALLENKLNDCLLFVDVDVDVRQIFAYVLLMMPSIYQKSVIFLNNLKNECWGLKIFNV